MEWQKGESHDDKRKGDDGAPDSLGLSVPGYQGAEGADPQSSQRQDQGQKEIDIRKKNMVIQLTENDGRIHVFFSPNIEEAQILISEFELQGLGTAEVLTTTAQ